MKLLTVLLVLLIAAPASAQEVKIGYVDLQQALNESDAGRKAKQEFQVEMDKLRDDLKKQREDVENLRKRLEQKAAVLKEAERRDMEKDYQRQVRDFERSFKDSQTELQAKDSELTEVILRDLQEVIREYGEKNKYLLILEAANSAVLYGTPSADITAAIIEAYDAWKRKGRKD